MRYVLLLIAVWVIVASLETPEVRQARDGRCLEMSESEYQSLNFYSHFSDVETCQRAYPLG